MNNEKKEYANTQFKVFNRTASFMEVSGDYFGIGKLRLGFRTYDKSKKVGEKITQNIDISFDISEALVLSYKIIKGEIQDTLIANKKIALEIGEFPKAAYEKTGGTKKEKAKRADGNALSRLFHIECGNDEFPVFFKVFSGPGKTEAKGGILPMFKLAEAEQQINISMSYDDLREFAAIVDAACRSYFIGIYDAILSSIANNQRENMNSQFLKYERTSCFMELDGDSFGIEHIRLGFRSYDKTQEKGNKITNGVDYFLKYNEGLELAERILTGSLVRTLKRNKKKAEQTGAYPEPAYKNMGGTNADKAKRKDNKALSRIITVENSTKATAIFKAISGPGRKDSKGLVVPEYKLNAPENRIIVPMSDEDLLEFALTLRASCSAYYAFQAVDMFRSMNTKIEKAV